MTDQEPPVDDVQKSAMYGTGERGAWENIDSSGGNSKYQKFKHERDKELDAEAENRVDEQSKDATKRYNSDPVVQTARTKIQDAQATRTEEEAAEVEEAENAHVDNVFQERARAAEEARIKNIREKASAEAKARANQNAVDPFQNSDYVAPTEDEVAKRKEEQLRNRDEYNDQVFQEEQKRKAEEEARRKAGEGGEAGTPAEEGPAETESPEDEEARRKKEAEEAERQRRQEEYNAMVHSDDPNVRLKTVEGLVNERNDLAKQHMMKMANAIAQTAAEMGGQMASKGWDLAGNIVKMTFTQPHAMSSSSRLIGTAMSAVQTAGDFADRSMEKYKIDANADPNLMKNTIRYKLYKREAQMGKNTVGNTFRAISESLGNMGLQDASQMTPDQLEQHVADMQAEADRLIQASKDPKLSAMERSLIKAQADHLQGYMAGLGKQGATMAQNQRIAARRQKKQDLATRKQNYQVLSNGSPNPYKEALEWADPRFGIEVDPQTGRPTNPSAYNRMLNAVITQHQNEVAAAGGKLDPAREKWFNDLQNKIHNDIQAMKQDKMENPLRGRAEIYARIGRVAPGFEKYVDNIETTGIFPANSTQSTRSMRNVAADYLHYLTTIGKFESPEYNHAKAFSLALGNYNNMKKLMSRIAGLYPTGMENARKIHEEAGDDFAKLKFTDNARVDDYVDLAREYASLMKHLPLDPKNAANFKPTDPGYVEAATDFNDKLTFYIHKWFPGAGWSVDDDEEDTGDGKPKGDGDGSDENYGDVDRFVSEAFQYLFGGDADGPKPSAPKPPRPPRTRSRTPKTPKISKVPKTPIKVGQYAPPKTEQDNKFLTRFPNYITVNTWLKSNGITSDKNPHMSLENYNKIRNFALKSGVSPEVFDSSPFATRHLPFEMMVDPIQQVIYDQKYRPAKERRNHRVRPVKGWEDALSKYLSNNPEILDLMSKNARGEDLTAEESAKVMQALVQNRLRGSSKTTPPGKKEAEGAEVPVEEEAEQPQFPAVTENDFIRPEVASQFRDARNIESINEGIAAIQSLNRDERASGYNDILYGLGTELGNDALFSEEYQNLMQTAFMDGSSRAIQLMSDQAQDPKDKLKILMAGRMTSPKSNESAKMLADFIAKYGNDYDVNAINTIINDVGTKAMQAQSDEGRVKIINTFLDNDLDPSLFNHREGGKKDDTSVDEEETEEAFDPNSTDAFEQDADPGRGLVFSKDSQYKDFKSMAEAMGADFEASGARIAKSSKSQENIRNIIGGWLQSKGINARSEAEKEEVADEIYRYLCDNNLIPDILPKRKKKANKVDENLEGAKGALISGPAADKNSLTKDKKAISGFNKLLKDALKNGNLSEEEKSDIEQRFNDFMKTRESDLKVQYSNLSDMTWKAQAVEDFKNNYMSELERAKITPGKAGEIDLTPEKLEIPKFDESGDPETFMRAMVDLSKKYLDDKFGYAGPEEDHDIAIQELTSSIKAADAQIDHLTNKDNFDENDNNTLNRLYAIRADLINERVKWQQSKDMREQDRAVQEFGKVFERVWNAAKNYDEIDERDLDYINTHLNKLPFKVFRNYSNLMSGLDERVHAAKNARRTANAYGSLEELEKLKQEAQNEPDFDFDTQFTEVTKKWIDSIINDVNLGLLSRKELDDFKQDMLERIEHMPKKDRDEYLDKWGEAERTVSAAEIGKGVFESKDPSDWLGEIESEKDLDKLKGMKEKYGEYIKLFDKKVRGPMEKELDEAYDKAANRPKLKDTANKYLNTILERGAYSFNMSREDKQAWDRAVAEATAEEQEEYEKYMEEVVKPMEQIAQVLEDKFHTTYNAVNQGNNFWKNLSDMVREAYQRSEDDGNSAAYYYEDLMRKMKLSGSDKMIAADLLKRAKPKKGTTKSLSVRDLFRARNADWE